MNQTKSDILIVKLVTYKVDKSGNKEDFFLDFWDIILQDFGFSHVYK